MMFIPKAGLFDSVYAVVGDDKHGPVYDRSIVLKRNLWKYLLSGCEHGNLQEYVRIDHRAGPGSFADNYRGFCCKDCGRILAEYKTN